MFDPDDATVSGPIADAIQDAKDSAEAAQEAANHAEESAVNAQNSADEAKETTQQLRDDLQDPAQGPSVAIGAFAGIESYTTFTSIGAMSIANLPVGISAKVGTTVFKIVAVAPVSGAYPLIATRFGYAVPVKDHTAENYGSVKPFGEKTSAADWGNASNKATQGIEFDARAGSIVVSSLNKTTPEQSVFIEFDWSTDTGIGAERMRTGILPSGHSEYFAIEYGTDGQRYIWVGDDNFVIRKIQLVAGATIANTVASVNLSAYTSYAPVYVFGYDHEHAAVWMAGADTAGGTGWYICKFSDLSSGVFAPVAFEALGKITPVWTLYPGHIRANSGVYAALSGFRGDSPQGSSASWMKGGEVVGRIPISFATTGSELQGIGMFWNPNRSKFETALTIWYGSTGRITFHNLTSSVSSTTEEQLFNPFYKQIYLGGVNSIPVQSNNRGARAYSPVPISAAAFHIGGDRRVDGAVYDSRQFIIAQHTFEGETRQSAYIRYRGMQMTIDGPQDDSIGSSWRWNHVLADGTSKESVQFLPHGFKFGNSRLLSNTSPKWLCELVANTTVDGGVFASTTGGVGPGFVTNSVAMSLATTGSDIFLGSYNTSTKLSTPWWYINAVRWRPATDGATDIGGPSFRIGNIYLLNNPVVTCDGDEKSEPVDIPDSWLDAYGAVRILGWKWLRAISEKGDKARIHTGPIAQHMRDELVRRGVMKEGSTDCPWGGLCYSSWDDEFRTIPAVIVEHPAVFSELVVDSEGHPVLLKDAWTEQVEPERQELVRAAGSSWGIRPAEWHFMGEAWQRRENLRMQERMKRLEDAAGLAPITQ